MSNAQGKPLVVACAVALAIAVPSLEADVRPDGLGPHDRWNRFTAEVTVRRTVVRGNADPAANTTPAIVYRWERVQSGGRWKTTMEVTGSGRAPFITPTGVAQPVPPVVARIEDDGGEAGPVFYGADGRRLRLPMASDRRKMGVGDEVFASADALITPDAREKAATRGPDLQGRDWIDALMPSLQKRGARAQGLERRLGPSRGTWRGHDRYLETKGDDTTEVLIDGTWAIPVEVNVVRAGVLRSHATFAYAPGPGGSMVRRSTHVERVLDDESAGKDARMVMDVELANVRLEERR